MDRTMIGWARGVPDVWGQWKSAARRTSQLQSKGKERSIWAEARRGSEGRNFPEGVWRNGSASDSRSEGWEFESLCPHLQGLAISHDELAKFACWT